MREVRRDRSGNCHIYSRPAFLRLQNNCEVTGTFKYAKSELMREGFNPDLITDAIYFDNPQTQALHRLDGNLYESIQAGKIRL